MQANGEAIYGTRPWKISGVGPATETPSVDSNFNEKDRKDLTAEDIRFTTKGDVLYAFVMGLAERQVVISPLAVNGNSNLRKISAVELLGWKGELHWAQDTEGLKVQLPESYPGKYAVTFKVKGAA
jgi:alpha-L-fucosidase